jgi:cytidylate kinase
MLDSISPERSDAVARAARRAQGTWSHPAAFTIAISRQAGANAAAIAEAVARRLGWPLYDHELVARIAREMGYSTHLAGTVDERRPDWWRRCLQALGVPAGVSPDDYVCRLVRVLLRLAETGRCIVVGRGAAQLLPEGNTLRVWLGGPRAKRVQGIQDRFDLTPEEAARWVDATDERRAQFVRQHFLRDPDDPTGYDLMLDSTRLSAEECADLVVTVLGDLKRQAAQPMGLARREAPSAGTPVGV